MIQTYLEFEQNYISQRCRQFRLQNKYKAKHRKNPRYTGANIQKSEMNPINNSHIHQGRSKRSTPTAAVGVISVAGSTVVPHQIDCYFV